MEKNLLNLELVNKIRVTLNKFEPRIKVKTVLPKLVGDKLNIELNYTYTLGGESISDTATIQLDIEESY